MIFSRKSSALTIFTERGSSTVNSLKKGASNVRRMPGIFSNSESANCALDRFCSAISRKPSLPSSVRCTVAASAQSAWFVQMLEGAFSRRMCCSRGAGANPPGERPAVTRRQPETLAFHRHDVRFRRWLDQPEGDTFGNRDYEH